jgi:hypothetical protein
LGASLFWPERWRHPTTGFLPGFFFGLLVSRWQRRFQQRGLDVWVLAMP